MLQLLSFRRAGDRGSDYIGWIVIHRITMLALPVALQDKHLPDGTLEVIGFFAVVTHRFFYLWLNNFRRYIYLVSLLGSDGTKEKMRKASKSVMMKPLICLDNHRTSRPLELPRTRLQNRNGATRATHTLWITTRARASKNACFMDLWINMNRQGDQNLYLLAGWDHLPS